VQGCSGSSRYSVRGHISRTVSRTGRARAFCPRPFSAPAHEITSDRFSAHNRVHSKRIESIVRHSVRRDRQRHVLRTYRIQSRVVNGFWYPRLIVPLRVGMNSDFVLETRWWAEGGLQAGFVFRQFGLALPNTRRHRTTCNDTRRMRTKCVLARKVFCLPTLSCAQKSCVASSGVNPEAL
jgi:hypothetical protein